MGISFLTSFPEGNKSIEFFLLAGIKNTLDGVAGGVASKWNSARGFIQQQQLIVAELAPIKSVREKVSNMMPNGAINFGQYMSTCFY